MDKNFEWCFSLEQKVMVDFYDEVNNDLNADDLFIIKEQTFDNEKNQYFIIECIRTGEKFEAPASSLIEI